MFSRPNRERSQEFWRAKRMCSSTKRTARWLVLCALLTTIVMFAPQMAYAQGGCLMAAGPSTPSPLAVGQTFNGSFTIVNASVNTANAGDCEFEQITTVNTISMVLGCGTGTAS